MQAFHLDRSCSLTEGYQLELDSGLSFWGKACWGDVWLDDLRNVQSLVIDHIFEEVRLVEFPTVKSRFECLFGCEENELRYWTSVLGNQMHKLLVIDADSYDVRDANLLRAFPVLPDGKVFDPGFARECARLYWSGESVDTLRHSRFHPEKRHCDQPHFECLIHLPARVLKELAPPHVITLPPDL